MRRDGASPTALPMEIQPRFELGWKRVSLLLTRLPATVWNRPHTCATRLRLLSLMTPSSFH